MNTGPVRLSVFLRAVLVSTLAAGVVAALMSWKSGLHTTRIAHEGLLRLADEVTLALASGIAAAVKFRKADDIVAEVAPALERTEGAARSVLVFDAEGDVIAVIPPMAEGESADLRAMASAALAADAPQLSDDQLLRVELIRGKDGAPIGGIAIEWSDSLLLAEIAHDTMVIRLQAFALFVVLSAAAAFALRSSISLPLRRVGQAISRVAAADYATAVPECDRGDEIGALARDLDRLRLRLAEADAAALARLDDQAAQAAVVEHLRSALGDLSSGDLTHRIDARFPPEYEVLRHDLNAVNERLSATMGEVMASAARIRASTEKISRSSDDLSMRTENQAATLEESVAAIEELTQSVRQTAQDTRKVAEGVARSHAQAGESQGIVQAAVEAMSEIRKSSDQISRIIGVIDDIAFQTNLLALNAGVEAVRAGEAGRGFSVVASEVRALAQRTSESAHEIKTLIQGSASEVLRGVDLVDRTGAALHLITQEVEQVATLAAGLTTTISNQSQGLNEISHGMAQLDRVTQQNAGMVDQMAGAHRIIREDVERLTELVRDFRVAGIADSAGAGERLRLAS